MRVLVTGGAGFIGSHLVDALLARGHEPFVLDDLAAGKREQVPDGVPLFVVDIRDADGVRDVFERVRPEVVNHHAAQISVSRSVRDPAADAEINIVGLINVAEAASRVGTRQIVFASSGGAMYGEVSQPADEHAPADPISPYGIAKMVGERYLRFFAAERNLQAVALRYANVYGPRQNTVGEAAVIAAFCHKFLSGESPIIYGDGFAVRDFVYVGDIASANMAAMDVAAEEPFLAANIGTADPVTVNHLAATVRQLIQDELGVQPPPPTYGPDRPGDIRSNIVDASYAGRVLGWQPRWSLEDGLRETVRWFLSQRG